MPKDAAIGFESAWRLNVVASNQPPLLLNEPSCPLVHAGANFSQVKAADLLLGVTTQTVIYVNDAIFYYGLIFTC